MLGIVVVYSGAVLQSLKGGFGSREPHNTEFHVMWDEDARNVWKVLSLMAEGVLATRFQDTLALRCCEATTCLLWYLMKICPQL